MYGDSSQLLFKDSISLMEILFTTDTILRQKYFQE